MTVSIDLGKSYRDEVTGFEGVATALVRYLDGPDRVGLESLHDGAVRLEYFDSTRLAAIIERD
jgi:hypothetical protein